IAKWVGGAVRGDPAARIGGVSGVEDAQPSDITWIAHERFASKLGSSRAGAALVPESFGETRMPAILVSDPGRAVIIVLEHFAPATPRPGKGVHPTAIVSPSAKMSRDVAIGPYVTIGDGARIGE